MDVTLYDCIITWLDTSPIISPDYKIRRANWGRFDVLDNDGQPIARIITAYNLISHNNHIMHVWSVDKDINTHKYLMAIIRLDGASITIEREDRDENRVESKYSAAHPDAFDWLAKELCEVISGLDKA